MAQLKAIQDRLLGGVSNMLIVDGLIADLVLPLVSVKEKTGKLGKYGKGHLRIEHSFAGGEGAYRRVNSVTRSTNSYDVESHGLEALVTEDDYRNVQEPFKAEEDHVIALTHHILLGKEKALADSLTDTAVLTQNTTLSGTAQWSDYANSDPLSNFKTARKTVRDGCGMPANVAVMDWEVANTLAYSPQILDALGFTQNRAGQLSEPELAKALGVERLYIAKGVYNSAKEGQTDSVAAIWGKHTVFAYIPSAAGLYQQSLGYRIALEGQGTRRVFKSPEFNPPNSTKVLVDDSYDFLLSDVTCAYLLKSVIA